MYTVNVYKDEDYKWRWQLVSRNSKIVADGSEGYNRRSSCLRAAKNIFKPDKKVEFVFEIEGR